jgi:hypothetical protein
METTNDRRDRALRHVFGYDGRAGHVDTSLTGLRWISGGVEGGMDRLFNGAIKLLRRSVPTSKRATGLRPGDDGGTVTVVVGLAGGGSYEGRSISHVISMTPVR